MVQGVRSGISGDLLNKVVKMAYPAVFRENFFLQKCLIFKKLSYLCIRNNTLLLRDGYSRDMTLFGSPTNSAPYSVDFKGDAF